MAFTPYTGKQVSAATWNAATIPGWRRIVIEENAAGLPESLDQTAAADAAYSYMDDPLGIKGTRKTTITVEGLASQHDVGDTGLFTHAFDDAHEFEVQKAAGAGKDEYKITPYLKRRSRPAEIRSIVPYTITFEYDGVGAWAASAA